MQFDFNVQANQSQHIDVVGTFLKYKAGTGTIRVRLDGGGYIDLLPGQGVNNVNFTSVDVQDRTGSQNAGSILAGIYDFRDDRITGSVEVIDGGRTRTNTGQAFTAHLSQGADAANNSACQLWNPANSGKNLIVTQFVTYITGGYALLLGMAQTQIAGTTGGVASKRCDGPVSVASGTNAIVAPASVGTLGGARMGLATGIVFKPTEPFLVKPGWAITWFSPGVNTTVGVDLEFFEEPIL